MRGAAGLAGFVAACVAIGAASGLATARSVTTWYRTLERPSWTPPDALFAPVWSTLYVLMGVAGWLVWRAPAGGPRTAALTAWGVQLALNALWSPLFFGLRRPALAAGEIVFLWAAIAAFALLAWRVSHVASLLFAPYLAWVSYAAALNFAIAWLNRARA